jgi:hypothetical protein
MRHFGSAGTGIDPSDGPLQAGNESWHEYCFIPPKNQSRGTAMSLDDAISNNTSSGDFTLLEGLYQLAVTGHTNDWEFERLNNAVYERLLSSYGSVDMGGLASNPHSMVG